MLTRCKIVCRTFAKRPGRGILSFAAVMGATAAAAAAGAADGLVRNALAPLEMEIVAGGGEVAGAGYVTITSGDWIEAGRILVPARTRAVSVRYRVAEDATLEVVTEGSNDPLRGSLALRADRTDPASWQELTVPVEIGAGEQTLRVRLAGGSSAEVDWIRFAGTPVVVEPLARPTPRPVATVGEVIDVWMTGTALAAAGTASPATGPTHSSSPPIRPPRRPGDTRATQPTAPTTQPLAPPAGLADAPPTGIADAPPTGIADARPSEIGENAPPTRSDAAPPTGIAADARPSGFAAVTPRLAENATRPLVAPTRPVVEPTRPVARETRPVLEPTRRPAPLASPSSPAPSDSEAVFLPPPGTLTPARASYSSGIILRRADAERAYLSNLRQQSWVMYPGLEYGSARVLRLRIASDNGGGTVEVRLGSREASPIARATIPQTGGWTQWRTLEIPIPAIEAGRFDTYLVFDSPQNRLRLTAPIGIADVGGFTGDSERPVAHLEWVQMRAPITNPVEVVESAP